MISINYKLTFDDFRNYSIERLWKKIWIKPLVLLLVALTVILYWEYQKGYSIEQITGLLQSPLIIVLFLFGYGINVYIARFSVIRKMRKEYDSDKNLQEEKTLVITDDGVRIESASESRLISWDQISKVRTLKSFYAFSLSLHLSVIVPKHLLSEEVRRELDTLLGKRGKKR